MVEVTFTPNLHMSLLPANYRVWAQIMNDNLSTLDATINGFVQFEQFRGTWHNSTHYLLGDTVVDPTNATLWSANEDHVSPQIPITFLEDRQTHVARWTTAISPARNRGVWIPGAVYLPNDFVLAQPLSGDKYAMCLVQHTSVDFDADTALGYWTVLIDFALIGSAVLPALGGAVDASKFTGTSPLGTTYINFSGIEAMSRLAGILPVAKGGTGVTASTGTGATVLSDGATMTQLNVHESVTVSTTSGGDVSLINSLGGSASSNTSTMSASLSSVGRTVTAAGGVLREFGVNVSNIIKDFNAHIWRTNLGATMMQLDTYTLSLFGTTSGFTQLKWPAVGTSKILTAPDETGTLATREYVKASGATATFATPAKAATQALGGANVFFSGATTGAVGASGEKWLVFARLGIDQTTPSVAKYYTAQIWNGAAAVDTQIVGVFLASIVSWTSMFAIVTLSGPTTFTLRAASIAGGDGSLNGDSLIGAMRVG